MDSLRKSAAILAGLAIGSMLLPSIMMTTVGAPVHNVNFATSYTMVMSSLLLVLCFVFARLNLPAGKTPVFASVMTIVSLLVAVASLPFASSLLAIILYAVPYQFLTLALGSWAIWLQQQPEQISALTPVAIQDSLRH